MEFWRNRRPSPTLPPTQLIGLLMAALQKNDDPVENEGLRTVSIRMSFRMIHVECHLRGGEKIATGER